MHSTCNSDFFASASALVVAHDNALASFFLLQITHCDGNLEVYAPSRMIYSICAFASGYFFL